MGQKQTTQGQKALAENDPAANAEPRARSERSSPGASPSLRPEQGPASVRPSARPSFRPSAFGPPRSSQFPLPSQNTALGTPRTDASHTEGARSGAAEARSLPPSDIAQAQELAPNAASQSEPCVEIDDAAAGHAQEEEATPTPSGPRLRVAAQHASAPSSQPVNEARFDSTQRGFRADLEEILPLVATPSSLPRTLPAAPEKAASKPQDPRRNRLSLAIFGLMLAASAVPLVRYAIESGSQHSSSEDESAADHARAEALVPVPQALLASDKPPADPLLDALAAIEAKLPQNHVAAADQLIALGLRALSQRDERMAEALLGRALKHDDDNPRAYYALARIRLSQGNLEGAEGWIVSAIHKRPRRAEYHALYASVLEGLNRPEEAARARARAADLKTPD